MILWCQTGFFQMEKKKKTNAQKAFTLRPATKDGRRRDLTLGYTLVLWDFLKVFMKLF